MKKHDLNSKSDTEKKKQVLQGKSTQRGSQSDGLKLEHNFQQISAGSCSENFITILTSPEFSHLVNASQNLNMIGHFQKSYGNAYLQRVIQAKLKMGQMGDKCEQEADRVADEVVHMPEPQVERQPNEEEKNLETEELPGQDPELPPDLEARINVLKGSGRPLPESVRAFFEPRFGYGFNRVRIHTDSEASRLSRELGAKAFTTGHDVFFRDGAHHCPDTSEGRRLIAHELVHTIQQGVSIQYTPISLQMVNPEKVSNNEVEPVITGHLQREAKTDDWWYFQYIKAICDKLTGWWVTESDVRDVLSKLKPLTDDELKKVIDQLEAEELVDVIFAEIGDEERKTESTLLDRIRRLRPGKALFLEYIIKRPKICKEPPKGAWHMVDSFKDLSELIDKVEIASSMVLISKLGILAHGDKKGTLVLGKTIIDYKNINGYSTSIQKLDKFLKPDAIVYIYGCISGSDREGSTFLKKLSALLPGRMIVGFNVKTTFEQEIWDVVSKGGCFMPSISTAQIAQRKVERPTGEKTIMPKITRRVPADENNPHAKVAKNGQIETCPKDEKICKREELHSRE